MVYFSIHVLYLGACLVIIVSYNYDIFVMWFISIIYSSLTYPYNRLQSCYKSYPGILQSQETLYSPQLVLTPCSNIQQWYKVDGEHFEAVSLNVTIAHNKLQVFSPKYQHQK